MRRAALAAGLTVVAFGASGCVLPAPRRDASPTARVTLSASPSATSTKSGAWPPTLPAASETPNAATSAPLAQPADDVTLPTKLAKGYGGYGPLEGDLTVTNHSDRKSDYSIIVAAQTPDGSRQLDTGFVFVDNLEPGQTVTKSLMFVEDFDPASAVLVLTKVQRTRSF